MATIVREFTLDAPADQVWTAVADVGAVDRFIDYLGEVTLDGVTRTCQLADAGALEELIVTVDDTHRRLAYSIRRSPFGFDHHHASMQVTEAADGGTTFTWVTDLSPDTLAGAVVEPIDAAVDSIRRRFS